MTTPNPLQVIVTPGGTNWDDDGNPTPTSADIPLQAMAIAPGDTSFTPGPGGELDTVTYTVYLPLGAPISNDDTMLVRGKVCEVRVKEWISPWSGRGGLEVSCVAAAGVSP
jgi:hypothetical protein